jgi:hypothetical protein
LRIMTYAATSAAIVALSAVPAFAQGQSGHTPTKDENPGSAHKHAAPGQYCKAESKKHVKGQKGTPFSVCVKAAAKLLKDKKANDEAAPQS